MAPSKHTVIWDQPGEPPVTSATIVYWNEFFSPSLGDNKISLPQYVEDNSDDLKQRFLAFIRKIGETEITNKTTIEHLRILPGFSYWWMTLFACKRWSPSSNIIQSIRLIALEDILCEIKPTKVFLVTSQHSVELIIRDLCARSRIEFNSSSPSRTSRLIRVRPTRLIPTPFRAILVLVRELGRRIGAPTNLAQFDTPADVVVIDYLTRFDTERARHGEFRSGFWSKLVDALDHAEQKTLFLHRFVVDTSIPRRKTTKQTLDGLNSGSTTQRHYLLDARLSIRVVANALLLYFRLLRVRLRIRTIKRSFSPTGSQLDLWRLFRTEWHDSLSGSPAILHSLTISELDNTITRIPQCRTVLYLMENQPWEMAFVQLWRQRRSEPLVGVPHSTIRFWDLRYFTDQVAFSPDSSARSPIPNMMAVNGPAAMASMDGGQASADQIIEVEALSYLYLDDVQPTVSVNPDSTESMRLLVLGDFFHHQNMTLLAMLQSSLVCTSRNISVTVKPHPLCSIERQEFPLFQFQIDNRPLIEQLTECDIVLATNGTSAAAEAYQCGIPAITVLNGETFNFSPLRNIPGAIFVESSDKLTKVLDHIELINLKPRSDFFCIDESLPRWKHLLSI